MVRSKRESISIRVSKDVHKILEKDRDHFQNSIGGGIWSIADVVEKYQKDRDIYALGVYEEILGIKYINTIHIHCKRKIQEIKEES